MTNDLIKVDRVRSVEEAVVVERLGAGIVGVALDADPRFDDERVVTVERAAEIAGALRRATLAVAMKLDGDLDPGRVQRVAAATGARLVQPVAALVPPLPVRVALSAAHLGIVYSGIEISHDDDPGWVLSAYTDSAAFFQVDVLSEYHDSWVFLRDHSPEYPAEFQIADLNDLAAGHPLLVGFDFTPANVREILAALPAVRGIALTLADSARRGDARFHPYPDAVRVLEALGAS